MTFPIDALILNLGFLANLKALQQWGIELQFNGIKVDEQMRTNLPGVFAAGDIVYHPGKLKLISTGAGEAAIAVNNAVHYVNPQAGVEPGHSSHLRRPERRG
jgi:thioredoxin reductase